MESARGVYWRAPDRAELEAAVALARHPRVVEARAVEARHRAAHQYPPEPISPPCAPNARAIMAQYNTGLSLDARGTAATVL